VESTAHGILIVSSMPYRVLPENPKYALHIFA
jgi:hypothetical protein